MTRIAIDTLPSPIGPLAIGVAGETLLSLDLRGDAAGLRAALARRFADAAFADARDPGGVASCVRRYFDGALGSLDGIAVDPGGTPFQRRVWLTLRGVPPGRTWCHRAPARPASRPPP